MTATSPKPHLFFALPCYGGQVTEAFFSSFLRLQISLQQMGIQYSIQTLVNESLITRARNTLVAYFLGNPQATHLVFIDSDIRFDPQSILRLISHDRDIVGGPYPKKVIDWEQVQKMAPQLSAQELSIAGANYAINFVERPTKESAIVEVKDLATGFMMIKRSAIEKMMAAYPELKYRNTMIPDARYTDLFFDFFSTMIDDDKVYLSEDYTFCRRWQKLGGKIYCDLSISLDHIGTYAYRGHALIPS